MPRTLKLTIAYDGSAYSGWQRQENGPGIQAAIEDEIAPIVGRHTPIVAAGRTDAGVHAAAQVASLTIEHPVTCEDLQRALNARLTRDIRIRSIEETALGFDARRDAKSKTYRYAVWNGSTPSPFIRHVVWHVPHALDLGRMAAAARLLIGQHDFAAFQGGGSDVKTTTRRLIDFEVREINVHDDEFAALPAVGIDTTRADSRLIRFEVTGAGFLRHMVRNIVGTLVDIGRNRTAVDEMTAILESKNRAKAGPTAPAQGLMLWKVEY
ncbi:MAG: tRNA pseudouridine(38-40) synthase TruA [Vicinamibacterales bacterium]